MIPRIPHHTGYTEIQYAERLALGLNQVIDHINCMEGHTAVKCQFSCHTICSNGKDTYHDYNVTQHGGCSQCKCNALDPKLNGLYDHLKKILGK